MPFLIFLLCPSAHLTLKSDCARVDASLSTQSNFLTSSDFRHHSIFFNSGWPTFRLILEYVHLESYFILCQLNFILLCYFFLFFISLLFNCFLHSASFLWMKFDLDLKFLFV